MSCNEEVKFDYDDVKRNQTEFFVEDNKSVRAYHDIDRSVIHGYFDTDDMSTYAARVDSGCVKDNWTNIIDDYDKKMYLKKDRFHYSIAQIKVYGNNKITEKYQVFEGFSRIINITNAVSKVIN